MYRVILLSVSWSENPNRWIILRRNRNVFIEPFLKQLTHAFPGIRVARVDERFTSVIASRAILESGIKKMARRDKSLVDAVSANLILQSFMESERIRKEHREA